MLKFNKPTFEAVANKEWLVTNGLGGYASSTISGANSRRYHGLFVPSLRPPTERTVMVSKIEETIISPSGRRIGLSSNQYPGVVHPDGYQYITGFERRPFPVVSYAVEGMTLSKTIFMPHQTNTTVVVYENSGKEVLQLELTPLFVHRDYHSLFHQEGRFDFYNERRGEDKEVIYAHYGAKPLYVECRQSVFHPGNVWYKDFIYEKETYRGLDDREDACAIGTYALTLNPGQKATIVFTLDEDQLQQDWEVVYKKEVARLNQLLKHGEATFSIDLPESVTRFYTDLLLAGDQFLVNRSSSDGKTIIAGYHWFTDWGRDTMIAMRGLVIAGKYQEMARSILRTFLQYLQNGLIPNRFPDQGEAPEYNTIDAALWLFVVLHEYEKKFGDPAFIDECLPSLEQILSRYKEGTQYRIHMTPEGLLFGGEGLAQLTWMDAKVGDFVVTPRHGCPVEINALWYNAIAIYNQFRMRQGHPDEMWIALEEKVKESFRSFFMNRKGYLNDVVIPCEYVDDAFRPNQIYAISLPFALLTEKESAHLLARIQDLLWTPLGLRSLAKDHPDFIPTYGGDQWHRDKAYHQGTVWSFLMGEYLLAVLKTYKYSPAVKRKVIELMQGLQSHFYQSDGIHGLSEIFDGDNPGPGRGCMHQAWSAGMLLLVFDALKEQGSAKKSRTTSKERKVKTLA